MTKRIYISQFETPLAIHGTIEFGCKCGGKSVLGHDAHGWYVTGDGKVTVKPLKGVEMENERLNQLLKNAHDKSEDECLAYIRQAKREAEKFKKRRVRQ